MSIQEKYLVTRSGQVFNILKGVEVKPHLDSKGYVRVNKYFCGRNHSCKVHRLVAIRYIPNPENKPQVNHKNGIKTDNRVHNLEWNTNKENVHHAIKLGLTNQSRPGENNPASKLTNHDVVGIRNRYSEGEKIKDIALSLDMKYRHCYSIAKRESWKHI